MHLYRLLKRPKDNPLVETTPVLAKALAKALVVPTPALVKVAAKALAI